MPSAKTTDISVLKNAATVASLAFVDAYNRPASLAARVLSSIATNNRLIDTRPDLNRTAVESILERNDRQYAKLTMYIAQGD